MNGSLNQAFAALREQGVIAHKNFWCCQSCGCAAISEEAKGTDARGYVFFHEQDMDNLQRRHTLYLAYGSIGDDVKAEQIGHEIVDALREAGFTRIDWNGDPALRICLNQVRVVR